MTFDTYSASGKKVNRHMIDTQTFFITFDVDWAPDFMINEVSKILINHNIKATWFVTHNSPAIEGLRHYPELFELGIHPNFYPGSTHGKTEEEVMAQIKSIVTDAISMRTHGLYQNTNLLMKAVKDFGIKIDLSILLPYTTNITPHYLKFRNYSEPLFRIPFFWEDDLELSASRPSWDFNNGKYHVPGIKIFNFHPVHIALNSCSLSAYESLKNAIPVSSVHPNDIKQFKNSNAGVATLFSQLVQTLAGKGRKIKELYYEHCNHRKNSISL